MKKKIIAIIVIMLLLGGGLYGYKYYKTVYLPSQEAKYDIEETTEVETKEIGTVKDFDTYNSPEGDRYFKDCLDVMESAEESYFRIDDHSDSFTSSIIQMPKTDFSEDYPNYKEIIKLGAQGLEHFYNLKFREIKGSEYSYLFGDNVYQVDDFGQTMEKPFEEYGGVKAYFYEHELKLSCESVNVKKIGYLDIGEKDFVVCTVSEARVKTKDCKGDMSDLGLFAEKGKTKTIITKLVQCDDKKDGFNGDFERIYFK